MLSFVISSNIVIDQHKRISFCIISLQSIKEVKITIEKHVLYLATSSRENVITARFENTSSYFPSLAMAISSLLNQGVYMISVLETLSLALKVFDKLQRFCSEYTDNMVALLPQGLNHIQIVFPEKHAISIIIQGAEHFLVHDSADFNPSYESSLYNIPRQSLEFVKLPFFKKPLSGNRGAGLYADIKNTLTNADAKFSELVNGFLCPMKVLDSVLAHVFIYIDALMSLNLAKNFVQASGLKFIFEKDLQIKIQGKAMLTISGSFSRDWKLGISLPQIEMTHIRDLFISKVPLI